MTIPTKAEARIVAGLKRFQPILAAAKSRDVNESDTVVLVADMLQDIFGYDKYADITSEHAIRGTFCDLAIKFDEKVQVIIEVKAIGLELKDAFVKQAVDYAANLGVDWVVLTNGLKWRIYKISFGKPIDQELVVEFNIADLNPRKEEDLELPWLLAKEAFQRARLGEYHTQKLALSRFFLGALVLTDPVLEVIRRELKRLSPGVKIEIEQIQTVLTQEVLKREVLEGEKAQAAARQIHRVAQKAQRARSKAEATPSNPGLEGSEPAMTEVAADAHE